MPLAPASAELYFTLTQNEHNDSKGPENINKLHYDDIRGHIRPPHGSIPAAVKINKF